MVESERKALTKRIGLSNASINSDENKTKTYNLVKGI